MVVAVLLKQLLQTAALVVRAVVVMGEVFQTLLALLVLPTQAVAVVAVVETQVSLTVLLAAQVLSSSKSPTPTLPHSLAA